MLYYILLNNQQIGPLTPEQVLTFPVTADTPVKAEPSGAWHPLSAWPELASGLRAKTSGPDKLVAGILALIVGSFGVQYFYIGKTTAGFLTILLTVVTCGLWQIITMVQGIMMLVMSQQEFNQKYVETTNKFPLF